MLGVNTKHYYETEEKSAAFSAGLQEMMDIVNTSLKSKLKNVDSSVSVLFNAFTEGDHTEIYEKTNNMGADLLYADSGGLQIVTAGKEITEPLKDKVYTVQCKADRGMCFDVIPLESVSLFRSKTERSKINNKLFISENHREAGRLTGGNILRQCEIFEQNNASTKVLVIVQGNRYDDMLMYFDEIQKQIPEKYMKYIAGIALADTCMGNGELESIEMLKAGHLISKTAHPAYSQHLHLLGVGSISRMKPVIYMSKAGLLDNFKRISYDSTTHTSSLLFGKFTANGKSDNIGLYRNPHAEMQLKKIYDFFESYISKYATLDKFYNFAFNPETGRFTKTEIVNRAKIGTTDNFIACASVCVMYVYYQVHDFILQLDKAWANAENDHSTIGKLSRLTSMDDLNYWIDNYSQHVGTNRIMRKEERNSLESFFG